MAVLVRVTSHDRMAVRVTSASRQSVTRTGFVCANALLSFPLLVFSLFFAATAPPHSHLHTAPRFSVVPFPFRVRRLLLNLSLKCYESWILTSGPSILAHVSLTLASHAMAHMALMKSVAQTENLN